MRQEFSAVQESLFLSREHTGSFYPCIAWYWHGGLPLGKCPVFPSLGFSWLVGQPEQQGWGGRVRLHSQGWDGRVRLPSHGVTPHCRGLGIRRSFIPMQYLWTAVEREEQATPWVAWAMGFWFWERICSQSMSRCKESHPTLLTPLHLSRIHAGKINAYISISGYFYISLCFPGYLLSPFSARGFCTSWIPKNREFALPLRSHCLLPWSPPLPVRCCLLIASLACQFSSQPMTLPQPFCVLYFLDYIVLLSMLPECINCSLSFCLSYSKYQSFHNHLYCY